MGLLGLQIVNGITIGMIYGLAALGFTMVFKALGYLNFSHSNTNNDWSVCDLYSCHQL